MAMFSSHSSTQSDGVAWHRVSVSLCSASFNVSAAVEQPPAERLSQWQGPACFAHLVRGQWLSQTKWESHFVW
jgi:hypothetical protein